MNPPPKGPKKWAQINPSLNDYLSDPMEISCTFRLLHITDWWRQQEEMHSKYTDLSNVPQDIFSIKPHVFGAEASFSHGRDVVGWRQFETTRETLQEIVIVSQFDRGNNGMLAGDYIALNTTDTQNSLELKNEAEERKLHRMA